MSFFFLRSINLPYKKFECDFNKGIEAYIEVTDSNACIGTSSELNMNVSVPVYAIGVMCFLGWFFLALYGGIGFITLPTDFIIDYIDRPRKLTKRDLDKIAPKLLDNTTKLLRESEELKVKYAGEIKGKNRSIKTLTKINDLEDKIGALEYVNFTYIIRL